MKRSIFVLLILVTVVATLASCVPAAAPAAPAAPAAAQPAAADAANWCSNLRIVFFPGGPPGGVFANNVYNGAKQAQADLGPKVDYVFSDWDPQKMIQQFKEAAATKPDGIAVMGHPGDEAFDALIDDAVKNGHHRHQPEHPAADRAGRIHGQRLRLCRRGPLRRRRFAGQRGGQALRSEGGRSGHGLGPALAADARPAHQGRHGRAGESRPDGGLHRNRRRHQRGSGRGHARPSPATSPPTPTSSWS